MVKWNNMGDFWQPQWMRDMEFFECQAKREGFKTMKEFCEHYHMKEFYEKFYEGRQRDVLKK